jgi:hypothetical protein
LKLICDNINDEKPAECKQVMVGLYYESFDDRSRNFISNQLQLSDQLMSFVGIDFVPWGRTTVSDGTNSFICNGGPNECHADRIHACAYYYFWDTPKSLLNFVNCTVNHDLWKTEPAEAGNQCADQTDGWVDPWFVIEPCAVFNDTDDINIFLGMRDKTNALSPPLTSVPVITVNHNQNKDAEYYLINIICDNINGEKPSDCSNLPIITTVAPGGSASEIINNKTLMVAIAIIAIIFSSK